MSSKTTTLNWDVPNVRTEVKLALTYDTPLGKEVAIREAGVYHLAVTFHTLANGPVTISVPLFDAEAAKLAAHFWEQVASNAHYLRDRVEARCREHDKQRDKQGLEVGG